jgi:hypothetical protein
MYTDKPSDYTPSGDFSKVGKSKPVMFSREEVEKALPTFVGMGVNVTYNDKLKGNFSGHNPELKIGTISSATIEDDKVIISGGLWDLDFEDICNEIKFKKEKMGFSIEPLMYLADAGEHYDAKEVEFLGVSILGANVAAFASTYMFQKNKKDKTGELNLEKQELQQMLAEFSAQINKAINDNIEGVKAEFSAQIDGVSKAVNDFVADQTAEKERLALEAKEKSEAEQKAKAEFEAAEKAKVEAEAKAKADEEARRETMSYHVAPRFKAKEETKVETIADFKSWVQQNINGNNQ